MPESSAAATADEPQRGSVARSRQSARPARRTVDGPFTRIAAIWRKRRVLALLVRRDLKVRYADSILGYLWTILDPLLMGLIYWFVFAAIFQRSVGQEPYILYLLAGMLPFRSWFTGALSASVRAIKGERLVRSTALPREIWVLRVVCSKGIEYLFSLPVLLGFAVAYRHGVTWQIVYMLAGMALQFVLMTGLGLFVSALGSLARDVDRVMGILNRLLFYATPIIYGLNDVLHNPHIPDFVKYAYAANPMTGIVSLYRVGFFPGELNMTMVVSSIVGSVVALVVGWWVFVRLEPTMLKEI